MKKKVERNLEGPKALHLNGEWSWLVVPKVCAGEHGSYKTVLKKKDASGHIRLGSAKTLSPSW